jgi:response regulator RpfG family c-di-GMP phosphodiesterase
LLVSLFLLVSGTVFLLVQNVARGEFEGGYRRILRQINQIVFELNHVDPELPRSLSLQPTQESIREVIRLWNDGPIGEGVDERLFALSDRLSTGELSFDQGIQAVGGLAVYLGNEFYSTMGEMRAQNITIMVLVMVIVLGVAIGLLLMGRWITGSYKWIEEVLGKLGSSLSYSEVPVVRAPLWEEELMVEEMVSKTIDQVANDRSLLEYTMHGTLDDIFPIIKGIVKRQMPCDRLAIAFINQFDEVTAETAVVDYHKVRLHQGYSEIITASGLAKIRDTGQPRIINDLMMHYNTVHKSQGSKLVLEEGLQSSLTLPLIVQGQCRAFVFISSRETHSYTQNHLEIAQRLFHLLGGTIYHKYSNEQTIATTASGFVKLMEKKDNETSKHILRMSRYSYILAKQLYQESHPQITHRMLREILLFAPLHDIGKIAIPDSILLKPGKLDNSEMGVMKDHVKEGREVLEKMNSDLQNFTGTNVLNRALNIISAHHEKYDGTGYPNGLKGEEIPIEGRIVAVADVLDALTSKRPYKEAWTMEKATDLIKEQSGKHFDPLVVEALMDCMDEILEVYRKYKEV